MKINLMLLLWQSKKNAKSSVMCLSPRQSWTDVLVCTCTPNKPKLEGTVAGWPFFPSEIRDVISVQH